MATQNAPAARRLVSPVAGIPLFALVLRVVAFALFVVAAFAALGIARFQGDQAFVAWGLAALTLSLLVP